MSNHTIAIGVSDFRKIRQGGHYYIDKSLLVEEIMADGSETILLPRPRRFGKSLNLSMLQYFFDCMPPEPGVYTALFQGLAITHSPAWQHHGQYPVVFLTFKELKQGNFEDNRELLVSLLQTETGRHRYLQQSEKVSPEDKEKLAQLTQGKASNSTLGEAFLILTRSLHAHHGQPAILLLDEYDTPLIYAHSQGYYQPMLTLMRGLLGSALKGNPHITKAIVTGILRVAKESFFSGLNNPSIATVLDARYAERFGFTPAEVQQALQDFGLAGRYEEVNHWYNGYTFGKEQIYNPWSILNYLHDPTHKLRPHWVNTSSNALIVEQLGRSTLSTLRQMQELLEGQPVIMGLKDHTVFGDLEQPDPATLFSFLVFSGYLKALEVPSETSALAYHLSIPNEEVRLVYQEIFQDYLNKPLAQSPQPDLAGFLLAGDWESFTELLEEFVLVAFDSLDAPKRGRHATEHIYHTFMLGVLAHLHPTHHIRSNQTAGLGRADMTIVPRNPADQRAYVLEFKRVKAQENTPINQIQAQLEAAAQQALEQVNDRQYLAPLLAEGRQVYQLGLAFCGKQVAMAYQASA